MFGKGTGISSRVWAPGGACAAGVSPAVVRGRSREARGPKDEDGLVERVAEDLPSENEIKPIDWLVPVS